MEVKWMPEWSVSLGARAIEQGERAPWYMGQAWYLPYTDRIVCMPMPINWIAASCRSIWLRARKAHVRDQLMDLYRYAHAKGQKSGYDRGYEAGLRHSKIFTEHFNGQQ